MNYLKLFEEHRSTLKKENFTKSNLEKDIKENFGDVIGLIWDVIERYEDDDLIENAEVSMCSSSGLTIAICTSDLNFEFHDKALIEYGTNGEINYWICLSGQMNHLSELHTELISRIESIYELEDCKISIYKPKLGRYGPTIGDWVEINQIPKVNDRKDMILTLKIVR